jgi:hypothetical protein
MGEMRNAYNILVGKPRRRWKYNISMNVRKRVCEVVEGIHVAQDRESWSAFVNTVMNLRAL